MLAMERGQNAAVHLLTNQQIHLAELRRELITFRAEQLRRTAPEIAQPTRAGFVVGSVFLHQMHTYLTRGTTEWMAGITGPTINGTRLLTDRIEIGSERRSVAGVTGDQDAVFKVLIDLEKHGHALHALVHSHRFAGPPTPSGVDLRMQETFDAGGYGAIQAIFSEDGFVRFFGGKEPFSVQVYGTRVEQIDDDLFRLEA